VGKDILHKHYDETVLTTYSNKDLLYIYRFFYKNGWIEFDEWKKIEKEIIRRMG
jgi:hypothetical protein